MYHFQIWQFYFSKAFFPVVLTYLNKILKSLKSTFSNSKNSKNHDMDRLGKLNFKGVELDIEAQTVESLVDHSVLSIILSLLVYTGVLKV